MKLHHIGKVVSDLMEEAEYYREMFGLVPRGEPVLDPIQKVEVLLLESAGACGLVIELIRPVEKGSPVSEFLRKGGGLHHLCFEVADIHGSLETARRQGAIVLGPVVPGKGHGDLETAWIYTSKRELVELIQSA